MAEEKLGYNPTLDEIVFENRNKEYGAYDLRQNYRRILTRAFVVGTILFIVLVGTPFLIMTIKQLTAPEKTEVDANLMEILPEEEQILEEKKEEAPPPPPPKPEEVKQEIIQNVVPEPKATPKVETPPPPITKQLETTTGLINQEGEKKATYAPPPPPAPTKAAAVEVAPSTTEVYESVDQAADFAGGGINAFRNKFQDNFDSSSVEGEGTLKTTITFVVERDGTLTQVKAEGSNSDFNREAERAIKSIRGKWNPGKLNGHPVRSRFRFPVTMNFE